MTLTRRKFLGLLGGAVAVGALGAGGLLGVDEGLRHKLEDAWAYADGPDSALPASGARIVTGSFHSRFMQREVGWVYSVPARDEPRAIVLSLYGKGANQWEQGLRAQRPRSRIRPGRGGACVAGGQDRRRSGGPRRPPWPRRRRVPASGAPPGKR